MRLDREAVPTPAVQPTALHRSPYGSKQSRYRVATAHNQVLEELQGSDADRTYFSPAAFFEPGERTDKFRLGKDDQIADASGKSHISLEDYAITTVDELEAPAHRRERFTIGY